QWDRESGLYWMRARFYDPETGRFLTEDPIGIAGGMNLYAFSLNDPVNGWDSTGMTPENVCEWRGMAFVETYFKDGTQIIVCGYFELAPIEVPAGGGGIGVGSGYSGQKSEVTATGGGLKRTRLPGEEVSDPADECARKKQDALVSIGLDLTGVGLAKFALKIGGTAARIGSASG